jgi:hypothetical protein
MKVATKATAVTAAYKWDGLKPEQRELEWRRCRNDITYFAKNYFTIKVPGKGRQFLDLRVAQRETLEIWTSDDSSVTLKARQIGFSTLAALVVAWNIMFFADRECIHLSINQREAKKQLRDRIRYAWNDLPSAMRERAGTLVTDTQEELALSNGSSIKCLPSNNPARGYTAYLIFMDEAAFWEAFDAAWAAIEPAADIGGRIHVLSTANGVGNGFYDQWVRSTVGASDWKSIFYPWSVVPERDAAWYARKKASMPEWQLHQEYPSSPEEAFIRSGRCFFGDVDSMEGNVAEDFAAIAVGELAIDNPRSPKFLEMEDGQLQVFEWPSSESKYVIGADVAEGLDHGDFSVAFVQEVRSGVVAAKWRGTSLGPDEFAEQVLYPLGYWYGGALVCPEVNNHGMSTCLTLKRLRYPHIYRRRIGLDSKGAPTKTDKLGWHTNIASKRMMLDELNAALRDGDLELRDAEVVAELKTFVREVSGTTGNQKVKLHGSPFDDQVMALAITNQMRKYWWLAERKPEERSTKGTFAEIEDKLKAKRRRLAVSGWSIGS